MHRTTQLFALIVILVALSSGPLRAQENAASERTRISASAVVVRGMAATATTFIDFNIKRFTTDEERAELLRALQEGGQDALRRALEKIDLGQVSTTGRVGVPIAFARAHQVEGGTLYNIATARNMSFFELRHSGRSTDYPFGTAQIMVPDTGKKGEGQIIVAASIKINEGADRITVESFGFEDTVRLRNARVKKKKKKK
jgi:hypothetical protein